MTGPTLIDVAYPPAEIGWPAMLEAACAGRGVRSVYQPIVDIARGAVVGYEALVRFDWAAPQDPTAWFTAARAHGCHVSLEAAALRSALQAHSTLPANCFLTVNVSPDLLLEEPIREVWRRHGDLTRIVIELTEQVPIASYTALQTDLAALRAAGALLAVDDAGAGYAGLRHLLLLRPEIIKLDRDLVADLDRDEAKTALVEMVGNFAGRLDAWLLAEGIEREGELDVLASLGVPLVQGYLFARPQPPWSDIDHAVADRARDRARPDVGGATVRGVLETAPSTTTTETALALQEHEHASTVVVVDEHGRPRTVYTAHADGPASVTAGLRLHTDTAIRDALARAMIHEPPRRMQPLVCVDAAGRYLGIVRPERLIHHLVQEDHVAAPTR